MSLPREHFDLIERAAVSKPPKRVNNPRSVGEAIDVCYPLNSPSTAKRGASTMISLVEHYMGSYDRNLYVSPIYRYATCFNTSVSRLAQYLTFGYGLAARRVLPETCSICSVTIRHYHLLHRWTPLYIPAPCEPFQTGTITCSIKTSICGQSIRFEQWSRPLQERISPNVPLQPPCLPTNGSPHFHRSATPLETLLRFFFFQCTIK